MRPAYACLAWITLLSLSCLAQPAKLEANGRVFSVYRERSLPLPQETQKKDETGGKHLIALSYHVDRGGSEITVTRTYAEDTGFLGVITEKMTPKRAEKMGIVPYHGLYVLNVERDSAAQRSGIEKGDVILSVDGEKMSSSDHLRYVVTHHDLEVPAHIVARRGEKETELLVGLDHKQQKTVDLETIQLPTLAEMRHTGMILGDLRAEGAAKYFSTEEGTGVMVMNIAGGTPAFYSDLRCGDVILRIDDKSVDTPDQAAALFERSAKEGRRAALRARRGQRTFEADLTPVRQIPDGFDFSIPVVIDMEKKPAKTNCRLLWGLLFHYDREATDACGEPQVSRDVGFALNLFKYSSRPDEKRIRLLWFISWSW